MLLWVWVVVGEFRRLFAHCGDVVVGRMCLVRFVSTIAIISESREDCVSREFKGESPLETFRNIQKKIAENSYHSWSIFSQFRKNTPRVVGISRNYPTIFRQLSDNLPTRFFAKFSHTTALVSVDFGGKW